MKYNSVEIKDGNSTENVQYVGVYTLNWKREWGAPEIGFVEVEEPTEDEVVDAEEWQWIEKLDMIYVREHNETLGLTMTKKGLAEMSRIDKHYRAKKLKLLNQFTKSQTK